MSPLEPVITVIGDRIRLDSIPGSAAVLDAEVIQEARVFTVNEALRKVPGSIPRDRPRSCCSRTAFR